MGAIITHVFSDILIHVNWHCCRDRPLIKEEWESTLHDFIRERCAQTRGIHFHAVGGTSTHIHLAFGMEPFVNLSEFIGKLKGGSAYEVNGKVGLKALEWQRGYGVVSFARKHLPAVVEYVLHQKEHHANQSVREVLERTGERIESGFDGGEG